MPNDNSRGKMIEAAISLLLEERDIRRISIRRIAARAGVGIGLVNYHFQNKDNLIDTAVGVFIRRVIDQWDDVVPPVPGASPQEQVTAMLKATAAFLAHYPGLSRVSILCDLNNEKTEDNTLKTMQGLVSVTGDTPENRLEALHALSRLQWFFVRHKTVRQITGFDFFNETDRDAFIEKIVGEMFQNRGEPG